MLIVRFLTSIAFVFGLFGFSYAQDLNDRITLELSDTGELTVESSYLTNYLLRVRDPQTNEVGSARLLVRNDKSLDFNSVVDIEWEGLFPSFDVGLPDFATSSSNFALPEFSFPNNTEWEDTDLVFRGASLVDLVQDWPESSDEQLDTLLLLMLNVLVVGEVGFEAFSGADAVYSVEIMEKLRPLAERIQRYQTYLSNASDILLICEEFIIIADRLATAAGIDLENTDEAIGAYRYARDFVSAVSDLNLAIPTTSGDRLARRGTIAEQYRKLLELSADESVENVLNQAVNQFVDKYSSSSEEGRFTLIEEFLIDIFTDSVSELQSSLEMELATAKSDGATAAQIEAIQSRINVTKNAFAVAQLARFLFATDDFVALSKENPAIVIQAIFDVLAVVGEELISVDNIEIISKKAYQEIKDLDGRSVAFGKIRQTTDSLNQIMKAFQFASTVGNKMIPLLWDIVFAENDLSASVVEGQISIYGAMTSIVQINRNSEPLLQVTNSNDSLEHYVAADVGDIVSIKPAIYQPLLFEPSRAPWETNSRVTPSTVYTAEIQTPDRFIANRLCVRRFLGNTDFAVHRDDFGTRISKTSPCGEGQFFASDKFETQIGQERQTIYLNPDDLPFWYRANTPSENISMFLDSYEHVIQAADDQILVTFGALSYPSVAHVFNVIPRQGEVAFTADVSTATSDNLLVNAAVDAVYRNSPDPISEISWSWGDGTTSTATGSAVADLLNVMHTYSDVGLYQVMLTVVKASGQIATQTMEVNVLNPDISAPQNPAVQSGDERIQVSWDAVANADAYNVYVAQESFASITNLSDYETLAGGLRLPDIIQTSVAIGNLINGRKYYFVISAVTEETESARSSEVSTRPRPTTLTYHTPSNQSLAIQGDNLLSLVSGNFGIQVNRYALNDYDNPEEIFRFEENVEAARLVVKNGVASLIYQDELGGSIHYFRQNADGDFEQISVTDIVSCDQCSLNQLLIEADNSDWVAILDPVGLFGNRILYSDGEMVDFGLSNARGWTSGYALIDGTVYSMSRTQIFPRNPEVRLHRAVERQYSFISMTNTADMYNPSAAKIFRIANGKYEYIWAGQSKSNRTIFGYFYGVGDYPIESQISSCDLDGIRYVDITSRRREPLSYKNADKFDYNYLTESNNQLGVLLEWDENSPCKIREISRYSIASGISGLDAVLHGQNYVIQSFETGSPFNPQPVLFVFNYQAGGQADIISNGLSTE